MKFLVMNLRQITKSRLLNLIIEIDHWNISDILSTKLILYILNLFSQFLAFSTRS